jgi:CRISPR system Cascade subunit CasC
VDIHALQTVPYANLNRDDLGSPKTMSYGGAIRTRVSSQSWKRAIRLALERRLGDPAVRTRQLAIQVTKGLAEKGWADDLAEFAGAQIVGAIGNGLTLEPKRNTSVLIYLPKRAITDLIEICQTHQDALGQAQALAKPAGEGEKKRQKKATTTVLPADEVIAAVSARNSMINLFGRMLAELPSSKVDGAVQVAHAFTTHVAEPEVDFFTAVDDLNEADDTGSGHLNSAEFSAGVFYRYACVNVADLSTNLDSDEASAIDLTAAFLDAFITSLPGAKKNSTAPFTVPDLVYVAVRADRPISLAAAFEQPVKMAAEGGYASRSRASLDSYGGNISRLIGTTGQRFQGHATVDAKDLEHLGSRVDSYQDLINGATAALAAE